MGSELPPDAKIGIGGAPTRATTLPNEPQARKEHPVASGVLDYFPDAIVAISNISFKGNQQHNPGQPLFWNRGKSSDEADTMMRHFLQRGTLDVDGVRHSAKMAWRALALLQKEIEEKMKKPTTSKEEVGLEPGGKVDVSDEELKRLTKKGWTIQQVLAARPVQAEQSQRSEPHPVASSEKRTEVPLVDKRPASYSR